MFLEQRACPHRVIRYSKRCGYRSGEPLRTKIECDPHFFRKFLVRRWANSKKFSELALSKCLRWLDALPISALSNRDIHV